MLKFFPLIFVFLWSSAFITGKVIVEDSSPIAALCFRFAIVTFGFFLYSLIAKQKIFHPIAETSKAMATGILFHGIYLGGCWFAFSKGMPAVIANRATQEAMRAIIGNASKTSIPKTNKVPPNPKTIPIHCLHVTLSPNKGPASNEVRIG